MAYKLIWAPSACLDLKELASYIAESRPEVSNRFVSSVFHTIEHLTAFPQSGRIVPEFNDPNIREVIRKPCRIVYRVKQDRQIIEIVRVWHAARGIPEL
ncbi:MAG: type II toxin-antitoxin system RelE/ParE family toxin [Sedimentisphaerales bacterium]|nr:type II toxin-antitoxin system RelE/ParE family toxin [Sedimentisphaerales bacterium]